MLSLCLYHHKMVYVLLFYIHRILPNRLIFCFLLHLSVFAAFFGDYRWNMSRFMSILVGSSDVWRKVRGCATAAGGAEICFLIGRGWRICSHFLMCVPSGRGRETAVLLVWTKWLRGQCQRDLCERLPWLPAVWIHTQWFPPGSFSTVHSQWPALG